MPHIIRASGIGGPQYRVSAGVAACRVSVLGIPSGARSKIRHTSTNCSSTAPSTAIELKSYYRCSTALRAVQYCSERRGIPDKTLGG
eukprot:469282-Rhodomonas_salina.2